MLKINSILTAPLYLLTRVCFSEPSLVIPFGSYMETVPLSALYISDNKLHYSIGTAFTSTVSLDCWQAGNDIYFNGEELGCNTSTTRDVENAARFLYSTLIPYGSYLENCIGLLKTLENFNDKTHYYLYASCRTVINQIKVVFRPQKIDITDCPAGHLINRDGNLICATAATPQRKVVSGSYLTSGCDVADSYYSPTLDRITTRCHKKLLSVSGVKSAIHSGKDVVYRNQSLEFADTSQGAASIHEASLYLPAGNYAVSCRNAAFFPCMGQEGKGLLVATCLSTDITGIIPVSSYKNAFLEDADNQCSMHNMGYVSNINGELVCDPDVEFDYEEDPTQAELVKHLQCPASE